MPTVTSKRKTGKHRGYQYVLVLDEDDRAALELVAEHEKLSRADAVRRLIRARAQRINDNYRERAAG